MSSSLGVSINYGHVPIFPNPNLQYLRQVSFRVIIKAILHLLL